MPALLPLMTKTWGRSRPRSRALRLVALSLVFSLATLWLGGCARARLVVVVGSVADEPAVPNPSEIVFSQPTPHSAPVERPIPPIETPTPTPQPVSRPPAHSAPTRIVAPSIGLDAPVVTVGWSSHQDNGHWFSEWETASYAAGFHKSSALPGHKGNTVISGHHNIKGKVFEHLVDLKPGDLVILYADGRAYRYRVKDKFIVKEKGVSPEQRRQNALWIAPTRDERLTLVACWPPTGNTYRVIVIAKPEG
ncbi:MAG: sortase [Anaerolineae bacterium]|nr:sortase [Anaerolineae bacterium]